jgi:hypothetical protein
LTKVPNITRLGDGAITLYRINYIQLLSQFTRIEAKPANRFASADPTTSQPGLFNATFGWHFFHFNSAVVAGWHPARVQLIVTTEWLN